VTVLENAGLTAMPGRLDAVGVGPLHEKVYRHLVAEGGGRTPAELSAALGLPLRATRAVLRALENQSLVAREPTRPSGYVASPPELALETLVARRGEELAQIRLLAKELQHTYRRAAEHAGAADLVEVVVGRDELMRHYLHLVRRSRTHFDSLTKPPYVEGPDTDQQLVAEGAGIQRGVRARSVYEIAALDEATTIAVAERSIEIGEEARTAGDLPMKLSLFDRQVGFIPLDVDEPDLGALIVHPSPLLAALTALFDNIWARAVPLLRAGRPAAHLDDRSRQVLLLMAAGLKDESIARTMGMSRRTVQKTVSETMGLLGAKTRFQAALLARERGWVGDSGQR
jgi:DNA-binding CsgD family transcriptional regulator/sugar-specific transcriptional regulator TrmB